MPKQRVRPKKARKKKAKKPEMLPTIEVDGYITGTFLELNGLSIKYAGLTRDAAALDARIELTENHLRATRDHLAISIKDAETSTVPRDWTNVLAKVAFVGARLADACVVLLKTQKRMTPEQLLIALNAGMFRFRTNSPLREIHGALLRHPQIERQDGEWVWLGDQPSLPMPLKAVDNAQAGAKREDHVAESA